MWFLMCLGEGKPSIPPLPFAFGFNLFRVPKYSFRTLTEWWHSPMAAHTAQVFQHLFMRALTNLEILEEIDIVTKTA